MCLIVCVTKTVHVVIIITAFLNSKRLVNRAKSFTLTFNLGYCNSKISDAIKNYGCTGWLLTRRPVTSIEFSNACILVYLCYYYYALLVTNK